MNSMTIKRAVKDYLRYLAIPQKALAGLYCVLREW